MTKTDCGKSHLCDECEFEDENEPCKDCIHSTEALQDENECNNYCCRFMPNALMKWIDNSETYMFMAKQQYELIRNEAIDEICDGCGKKIHIVQWKVINPYNREDDEDVEDRTWTTDETWVCPKCGYIAD